ncbi:transposon protein, putative, CACTA, En/Spm sub-class [Hordeum vulgare]|nr:transposon protein, putative, CACTA, En/Spm sub-class [Hordeum vulgare]
MDGEGFDVWGSQPSASGPATHVGLDLNSQASASEGFLGLGLYEAFLQSDDELLPGRGRAAGLPPYRPPRTGPGDGWANPSAPLARQLNFGVSSLAAAGRGGGNNDGGFRQRTNSTAVARGRRNQRSSRGGQRVPPSWAPWSAVRGQASGSGAPFDNDDEELEDDIEELASFGGPPVSQRNRAQWNDVNSASLLELCIEQRTTGTYNGTLMTAEGYQVLKMKFRILLNMPIFLEDKQIRIIVACMALHNFIREERIADREFDACDADENYNRMPNSSASAWPEDETLVEDVNMNAFCDELAHALFHGV